MRILYVTTISLTMNSFFKPHIEMLVKEGYQVDIACNYRDLALADLYSELGCVAYQIDFSRSPLALDNFRAYGQLKKLIANGNYDIVHCHTPNAAVITRLVCRKFRKENGLKVFYTAHGFHFFKGAPKLNWMVYYPIEKFCSRFTDKLITINQEDYALAQKKFKAKEVHYVPGVGIDLSRFENVQVDRAAKRHEIGIPEDAFLLISVGELSKRKNHRIIIDAMSRIRDEQMHYIIVGEGALQSYLMEYTEERGLTEKVHFLGYRRDIAELYKTADLCCFPSIHEGLPVALMEAMACGVAAVGSKIRGNEDLIGLECGVLIDTNDANGYGKALQKLAVDDNLRQRLSKTNQVRIALFSKEKVLEQMHTLYN